MTHDQFPEKIDAEPVWETASWPDSEPWLKGRLGCLAGALLRGLLRGLLEALLRGLLGGQPLKIEAIP